MDNLANFGNQIKGESVDVNELLQSDFQKAREDFDLVYYFVGFLIILVVLWTAGLIGGEKPPVEDEDDKLRNTPYTLKDIQKFNGQNQDTDKKVYIGCSGYVFDVSESPNFKEGGMYEKFAGNDISIACAHYSTDEKYLGMEYERETAKLTFDQE